MGNLLGFARKVPHFLPFFFTSRSKSSVNYVHLDFMCKANLLTLPVERKSWALTLAQRGKKMVFQGVLFLIKPSLKVLGRLNK